MYPTVRDAVASNRAAGEASLAQKIVAGAITGSGGAGIANAIDVVRVRMTAEGGRVDPSTGQLTTGLRAGHKPRWRSSMHCLTDTAAREGVVRGLLLRGLTASMSRAGLLTAAQMSTYDHTKTVRAPRPVNASRATAHPRLPPAQHLSRGASLRSRSVEYGELGARGCRLPSARASFPRVRRSTCAPRRSLGWWLRSRATQQTSSSLASWPVAA
jgi:hypothetical protein